MTQKDKIAALEAKLAAAEAAVQEEEADRIDPEDIAKAKKASYYAMKDIEIAIKALDLDLNKEQVQTVRTAVYENKLAVYTDNEKSSLTGAF